jgi:hypothetical protein
MNIEQINKEDMNKTLLKLEILQKEYEVVLKQYQEACNNYITILENKMLENKKTNDSTNFVSLKGRTWWGTAPDKEGTVQSQKECEDMCAQSKECSGATFNPVKRYCWTRKGETKLTVGRENDYALITKEKEILSTMKHLNEKLVDIHAEIIKIYYETNPTLSKLYDERVEKQQKLQQMYEKLIEHKVEIDGQLTKYNSINMENMNQDIYVNQQSLSYNLWFLLAIIIVLYLLKNVLGINNPPFIVSIAVIIIIAALIVTILFGRH